MNSINLAALELIKASRSHATTKELAVIIGKSAQTIRKLHCLDGHVFGIRPVKLGNALSWSVAEVEQRLTGGAA